jgi:hypothetical protein
MRIIPSVLLLICLVSILAQASEPVTMPEVQTLGVGVIWRESDVTNENEKQRRVYHRICRLTER